MVTTLAGASIVASASSQGRYMELVDRSPVTGLKRKVNIRHVPTGLVHKQFIRIEVVGTFNDNYGKIQRLQDRAIKTLACLEVRHSQVDMIDKPSEVELHFVSHGGYRRTPHSARRSLKELRLAI